MEAKIQLQLNYCLLVKHAKLSDQFTFSYEKRLNPSFTTRNEYTDNESDND